MMKGIVYLQVPKEIHGAYSAGARLVNGDGLPPHITVAYFDSLAAGWSEKISEVCRKTQEAFLPLLATFGATRSFTVASGELVPWYCEIHGEQIRALRKSLLSELAVHDIVPSEKFSEYVPHTTLEYLPKEQVSAVTLPQGQYALAELLFAQKELIHE
jgi:2'-5' RNA ligase